MSVYFTNVVIDVRNVGISQAKVVQIEAEEVSLGRGDEAEEHNRYGA